MALVCDVSRGGGASGQWRAQHAALGSAGQPQPCTVPATKARALCLHHSTFGWPRRRDTDAGVSSPILFLRPLQLTTPAAQLRPFIGHTCRAHCRWRMALLSAASWVMQMRRRYGRHGREVPGLDAGHVQPTIGLSAAA